MKNELLENIEKKSNLAVVSRASTTAFFLISRALVILNTETPERVGQQIHDKPDNWSDVHKDGRVGSHVIFPE